MELRSKPIDESITIDHEVPGRRFIEYQPGDATRYLLLFVDLDFGDTHGLGQHVGSNGSASVVTLLNWPHCPSVVLQRDGGFLAPAYVEEKLGVGGPSSVTLAEIIAHVLGREADTPERYRERYGRSL